MIYEGVVYFAGPQTLWGGQVAGHEVIFRARGPWLWVVRMQMLSAYGPLNHERCGYVLKCDGKVIAYAKASDESAEAESAEDDIQGLREIIREASRQDLH